MVRLGVAAELKRADALLAQLSDEKTGQLPDVQKARALRSLVMGNFGDARSKLNAILQKAPADAVALITLGWTELGAGDPAAADKAFANALAAESTRAASLYASGVAKEQLGDGKTALDLYARALARSPQHFGATVAIARLSKPPMEAQAEIEALIKERGASAGPKEVAEAWAALGALAAQAGRRDEAEDRLKRALQLDPELGAARVTLAEVQCDLKHCAEAIAPLQKLVAAQPRNLQARLALARAQLETNAVTDAQTTLAPAIKDAPKDADVLYWQGRALVAQPKPDREQAAARFKDAVAANPKLIAAYVAQSNALAALGQSDEAVAALQKAQDQASDNPELMVQLGEAYLGLGKAGEAEQRFRAALATKAELTAARMDLGLALEAQNKLDDAKAEYEKVDAKYPGATERLGRLAVKQGRKSDADQLFTRALAEGTPTAALRVAAGTLDLDPTLGPKLDDARKLAESVIGEDERSAPGHLLLAEALFAQGKTEDALPEARRAAALADMPEAHLLLGRVLEQLAKLDQAINEYNLARRPPVEGAASLGRARILVRMGATKDALAELTALGRDPKLRAQALLLTGDCYADLQQADRARHAYEDAVKAAPDSGDAAFKLGRAFHDAGRRHDTIAQVERALRLAGDKVTWAPEAWLLLGDAHREGHENDAAVKAYKRYLDLAPADAPARKEAERNVSILGGS
jgi:tetratricopeptide (TPR) repeat protein